LADLIDLPLKGITVVDFSQFLAGPVAALRLGDLGARVIKVERPQGGEAGRGLAFAGLKRGGDSVSFHAMNRNKESFAADLKDATDLSLVQELVRRADVVIENFRPGVMARLGLDYESLRAINPGIVYGSVSGYGPSGPWAVKPGQDLLAQAVSGLLWASGTSSDPPVPVGVSIADHLASCQLALGISALLMRRERTGEGGLVETSLLEGVLDLQFELVTAYFSEPGFELRRGGPGSANAYIGAPYGVYRTSDGYLALAMNPVPKLGELLGLEGLAAYEDPESWLVEQDKIGELLTDRIRSESTAHWLSVLEPSDVWCAPVLTLAELVEADAFESLDMLQEIGRGPDEAKDRVVLTTSRSPLRIDGQLLVSDRAAPQLGEHSAAIREELATLDEKKR